ncbi:MAG TPA: CHRD domain-containing protein [Anaeromyxobacteraceae bacterium]|nr:CHRD domain-containing protein [Anaeromyxobacteraceae bacterium]
MSGKTPFLVALVVAAMAPHQSRADVGHVKANLSGYSEVPAVSSTGAGQFTARLSNDGSAIDYELSYAGLEGTVAAAHIHIGQTDVSGGVMAFLCGGGGKPACPQEGTVTGTITAIDVVGPAAQGIAAGEFAEMLQAIDAGVTYVNVHSSKHPGGEIRGQVFGGIPK